MKLDVSASGIVEADREAIWAYATEPANDPEWISGISEAGWLTEPPLAEGTRVERTARFLRRPMEYVLEVVEHQPPSRLRMRSVRAPFAMDVTYEFEPVGEGTEVSIRVRGGPSGVRALANPLMAPMVKRSLKQDLRNLSERFEAPVSGPPGG